MKWTSEVCMNVWLTQSQIEMIINRLDENLKDKSFTKITLDKVQGLIDHLELHMDTEK